jgi:hypothetical protein
MPGFENYIAEARETVREIARYGVALGIDWDDIVAVRALAREALAYHFTDQPNGHTMSIAERAILDFFGLIQLMLKVMQASAGENMQTHGGPLWKTLARALWAEAGSQGLLSSRH